MTTAATGSQNNRTFQGVKEAPDGFYTFNAEERQAAAKGREVAWQMRAIKKQQLICSSCRFLFLPSGVSQCICTNLSLVHCYLFIYTHCFSHPLMHLFNHSVV